MSATRPAAAAALALVLAAAGCGGSSGPPAKSAAPPSRGAGSSAATSSAASPDTATAGAGAAKPRMSAAKRRYLAHFHTGCAGSDKLAAVSTAQLQALVAQIKGGDVSAVGRLTRYLQRLSQAFGQGLARMRALGSPPGPDAAAGRTYIAQAARLVAAIRQLGQSVGRLDARGIATANDAMRTATGAAHDAAARYGFETCASTPSGPSAAGPIV